MSTSGNSSKSRIVLRVLLVEDSPDDADLVLEELRKQGYEPQFARVDNAVQMKSALEEQAWDVVLCDYAMPSFDALAALAVMKSTALDVPFIIVSGTMGEDVAVKAMKAGAHDFFSKDKITRLPAAIEREVRDAKVRAERKQLHDQLLLSDRLVSIGTLAAGVAHEINNPLAYVIGNIEFAIERLARLGRDHPQAADMSEVVHALDQAREGTERIRVTTRDLKVFCRSDEINRMPVDVQRVLESAISMAWNEIRHRARLVRRFEPVPRVDASENRLAQVFLNLLINAAQSIKDSDAAQNEIRVTTRCENARVIIEIADTGAGMSMEVQQQLFRPFFTTKAIGVGTGLGLSICHGIVTDLRGEIRVQSRLDAGSTFRVVLPAGTLEAVQPLPYPASIEATRARILVIDDEPALCQIVQRLLRSDNDVVTSLNAKQALQLLSSDRSFDVILCDLMMPEMTGMEFHDELMRVAPELASRTIFLTGGAFTSKAAKFLDRVPNRRLEKPFDPTTLRATIAKLVTSIASSDPVVRPD
jgi:signal transduction histidine kinase